MLKFRTTYTKVSEETARQAKHNISFSDYVPGTVTAKQNGYVDAIVEYAEKLLQKNPTEDPEKIEKVQYYIDRYSAKIAEAIDKDNAITCRCPSVLITGAGNFPTQRKAKQNAAAENHWRNTRNLYECNSDNYYWNKIRLTLTDSGAIRTDDPKAVEKIKAKIQKLEMMPDPYGNNKTEIRRLKERLLILSPEEMKQGKSVTINGIEATYENIIALFNSYKTMAHKSAYDPDKTSWYLSIPLVFSDGNRKYKEYVSNEVDETCENTRTYDREKPWKPLDDRAKFYLIINRIHGSGNKAVIYSILKDLDPTVAEAKRKTQEAQENGEAINETATINGENVTVKENTDIMRLQVFFEGKPEATTRNIMKSNGFKWAPSQSAWQRLLNDSAKHSLERILKV